MFGLLNVAVPTVFKHAPTLLSMCVGLDVAVNTVFRHASKLLNMCLGLDGGVNKNCV